MEPTRTFFERRLQTVFQVTPALGAQPIGLTLHSVQRFSSQKAPPILKRLRAPAQSAFTLLFHGPIDPVLEQCIYALRPKDAPKSQPETLCFLVPLGPALYPSTMQYGALFHAGSSNS